MDTPIEIFISYADKDSSYLRHLGTYLAPLQRERLIQPRYGAAISPGTDREQAIKNYLETAQVILLLISSDFIASEDCYSIEMKRAIERHDRGEARVIPVILRPTDNWQKAPFGKLQAVPRDANGVLKPIQKWGRNQDDAYVSVVGGIRQAIKELTTPLPPAPSPDLLAEAQEEARPVSRRDAAIEKLRTQPFSELPIPEQTQDSPEKPEATIGEEPPLPHQKKQGKHPAVVIVTLLVCVLVIVLASVLFHTISQSRNHSQSTATVTPPTITLPPQSRGSAT